MKIALGTNIFGNFHRQDMCMESLKRLKEEFPDIIDLYNIQSPNNTQEVDGFKTITPLITTSKDIIPNCIKTKPMMKEMFGGLADLEGYDYFIFTNSDIILSNRFIKLIQDNWWWISLVGKKLFKFILKLWHNRKKKKNERQTSTKNSNS